MVDEVQVSVDFPYQGWFAWNWHMWKKLYADEDFKKWDSAVVGSILNWLDERPFAERTLKSVQEVWDALSEPIRTVTGDRVYLTDDQMATLMDVMIIADTRGVTGQITWTADGDFVNDPTLFRRFMFPSNWSDMEIICAIYEATGRDIFSYAVGLGEWRLIMKAGKMAEGVKKLRS